MTTIRKDRRTWRALPIAGVAALAALALSVDPRPAAANTVDVPFHDWLWTFDFEPIGGGGPVQIQAQGDAVVRFSAPFDMGTLSDPLAPPPGTHTVDIELVALSLVGIDPIPIPTGGDEPVWQVTLSSDLSPPGVDKSAFRATPGQTSQGTIQNVTTDNHRLLGDVFFDVWIDITYQDSLISNDNLLDNPGSQPIPLSMSFDETNGPPKDDIFWMPAFLWFDNTPPIEFWDVIIAGGGTPWDLVGPVHVLKFQACSGRAFPNQEAWRFSAPAWPAFSGCDGVAPPAEPQDGDRPRDGGAHRAAVGPVCPRSPIILTSEARLAPGDA